MLVEPRRRGTEDLAHRRRWAGRAPSLIALLVFVPAGPGAGAQENTYQNEKFGYTVVYPAHWFPSGNVYSNAFELRNYEPESLESTPERNRASVIVVDTVNESPVVTDTFLDSLSSEPPFCTAHLSIDGRRGVRVLGRMLAQPLGPGAARAPGSAPVSRDPKFFFAINLFIADGKQLISLEARTPVDADPAVIADILKIQESVRFSTRRVE